MKEYIIAFDNVVTEKFGNIPRQTMIAKLIRCKNCELWDIEDGTFPDIDDREWHQCKAWKEKMQSDDCTTPAWHFCGWGEEKDHD